jgi:CspA family cold shock protein
MATGIVRFYNDSQGFGLITPDLAGPTLFAHAVDIRSAKKLKVRQRVEFDVLDAETGARATSIRVID